MLRRLGSANPAARLMTGQGPAWEHLCELKSQCTWEVVLHERIPAERRYPSTRLRGEGGPRSGTDEGPR